MEDFSKFNQNERKPNQGFLEGEGEMAALIQNFDWSQTSLGAFSEWPQSLKAAMNILLTSPAPILALLGKEGLAVYNDSFKFLAHTKHPEILGARAEELWPEAADFIRNGLGKGFEGQSLTFNRVPIKLFRPDYPYDKWADLHCSPLLDEHGAPEGLFVVVNEVTGHVLAEKSQEEAEGWLKIAMEAAEMVGAWDYHIESDTVYAYSKFATLFSINEKTAKEGTSISEYLKAMHPDDYDRVKAAIDQAIKTGEIFKEEYRVIQKEGKVSWVLSEGKCFYDHQDNPKRFSGVAIDITDFKRMENDLEESKESYKRIFNQSSVGIAQTNLQGKFILVNDHYCEIVGRSKEELYQTTLFDITLQEDLVGNMYLLERTVKEGIPFQIEKRYVRPDQSRVWVNINVSAVKNKEGEPKYILGVCSDITDRKKAEYALKDSEERFRALADNISQLAWMADDKGWISWYNKRWYDYTGTTSKEMKIWGWINLQHPDHVDRVTKKIKQCFSKGEEWEDTFLLRNKEGEYRWFLSRAIPIKDGSGKVVRWFGTNTDITSQKVLTEQLEAKNRQLIRINNDLDNFIYTASHDLKSPITNIEGLVNALSKYLKQENLQDDHIKVFLRMMHQSIIRFKNIIKDLTEVAKAQSGTEDDYSEISFKQIVDEVKMNIKSEIEEANAIITADFSKAPTIYFSKKNLRSIIYNLLSNALKYRSPERPVLIHLTTTKPYKNYIVLSVRDNGLGIREKDQSKVFNIFKRFHQHVEGTGIGLSIVKKIIDNNGGKIEIESKEGKGTIIHIYFKVIKDFNE